MIADITGDGPIQIAIGRAYDVIGVEGAIDVVGYLEAQPGSAIAVLIALEAIERRRKRSVASRPRITAADIAASMLEGHAMPVGLGAQSRKGGEKAEGRPVRPGEAPCLLQGSRTASVMRRCGRLALPFERPSARSLPDFNGSGFAVLCGFPAAGLPFCADFRRLRAGFPARLVHLHQRPCRFLRLSCDPVVHLHHDHQQSCGRPLSPWRCRKQTVGRKFASHWTRVRFHV